MTNEGDFLSINNSIDDEILGPEEDIVRCKVFMNTFRIKEDTNFYYFDGYSQCDIKVKIILIIID